MTAIETADIKIRDLLDAPACIDSVVAWIDAQWATMSGRTEAQTRERFTQGIVRDALPVTLVAVTSADACAGVASLRERDSVDWLSGVTPWICNVYVPAWARGHGVAGRLCLTLEQSARRLGHPMIHLATSRSDSLYHRIGYREIHRADYYGEQEYVLRKTLA